MNALNANEWESVRSLLSTVPEDCKIHMVDKGGVLKRDMEIWDIQGPNGQYQTAPFRFTSKKEAERFIQMVDALAKRTGASSSEGREWDAQSGTEKLPLNNLTVRSKPKSPPAICLGYVGGYRYFGEGRRLRKSLMDDLLPYLRNNERFMTTSYYNDKIWKSKDKRKRREGFDMEFLRENGFDVMSPMFKYLCKEDEKKAYDESPGYAFGNAKRALVFKESVKGIPASGFKRPGVHVYKKSGDGNVIEKRDMKDMPERTDLRESLGSMDEKSLSLYFTGKGNNRKFPVTLKVSAWEKESDRNIGSATLVMKWTGGDTPTVVYERAGIPTKAMPKTWRYRRKKWMKTPMYEEYVKEINEMFRKACTIAFYANKNGLEYSISMNTEKGVSSRKNITNMVWDAIENADAPDKFTPFTSLSLEEYGISRHNFRFNGDYADERCKAMPVIRMIINLFHPELPDTQGHTIIPMIPKLLNELTLYREALSEITRALNECVPHSQLPVPALYKDILLHIREIIAPFDYAEMEGEEE